jgi:hypothetical protein
MENIISIVTGIIAWVAVNKAVLVGAYLALVGLVSWIIKLIPVLPEGHWALPIVKFLAKWVAMNKTVTEAQRLAASQK